MEENENGILDTTVMQVDEIHLPENSLVDKNNSSNETTVIRSKIFCMNDIQRWISEFSALSNSCWNTRSSIPEGSSNKIVCSKLFHCHHSNFLKSKIIMTTSDGKKQNKRGISKSTNCTAKILIRVKKITKWTKQKDTFLKDGMPGIIFITLKHTHNLQSPASLMYLRPDTETENKFKDYFNQDVAPIKACYKHEKELEKIHGDDPYVLNNSRINPRYRTVVNWFSNWRKEKFGDGSNTDEKMKDHITCMIKEENKIEGDKDISEQVLLSLHSTIYNPDIPITPELQDNENLNENCMEVQEENCKDNEDKNEHFYNEIDGLANDLKEAKRKFRFDNDYLTVFRKRIKNVKSAAELHALLTDLPPIPRQTTARINPDQQAKLRRKI